MAETNPAEMMLSREAAARALVASDGFQLLVHLWQTEETQALDAIRSGLNVDRNIGRLQTVERIRNAVRALLPVAERDTQDDVVEEDILSSYDSGFSVPI